MNKFLKFGKDFLHQKLSLKYITFVMGNESCDLDSAISALVYSFFRQWIHNNKVLKNPAIDFHLFVPLLNIAKQDLPIKTEVVYMLKKYDINMENILFIEDIDFKILIDSFRNNLNVILVDHHIMDDKFSFLIPHISEILDHRPKDVANWKYPEDIKAIMSNVGSCTTLVCAEILNNENGNNFLVENNIAASFLFGTIILDTANFSPSADKAKPLDFEMAEKLEKILNIENRESSRKEIFDSLLFARIDYSTLTSFQLLRKDLKIVNGIPVPGLPLLVCDYLKRSDTLEALEQFCIDQDVQTILVMGLAIIDDEVKRDLCIFSLGTDELFDAIIQSLKCASNPCLELEEHPSNINNCTYFKQNNIKASRKQIVPILKNISHK